MARGSSGTPKALIEKQFRPYLAKHRDSSPSGVEAYEFNIKMYRINIPDIVRELGPEDAIADRINEEQQERLTQFAVTMEDTYSWISKWGQAGRSGGWLYFTTDEAVLDDNWEIPVRDDYFKYQSESGPHEWMPLDLKPAEKRLADLIEIEAHLKMAMTELKKDFANPAWWDIEPQDWMPKKKPTMGGIFDFMRKKPAEKQDLIRIDPVEEIPSGGLIPAGAPGADPFELLAPPPPARGVVSYVPMESQPMFDVLAPVSPAPLGPTSTQTSWEPPPRPMPARESRSRPAWALPTSEELVGHLRSLLNLPRIFSQIRSARKAPDFRRNLDRWAARGLPALIPVVPVATRELLDDFARFFGIPPSVLDAYARQGDESLWNSLFWPLFDILSEAFEIEKPGDLPGWFAMEHDPDTDEWWLVYLETE